MMPRQKNSKMCKSTQYLIRHVPIILLVLSLLPVSVMGQSAARGLGMGWAYTAVARGAHAPEWNSANLGLPDNPKFSMTIISLNVGTWNNSFTKVMYDRYLVDGEKNQDGDVVWSQQDIEEILNAIPDGGLGVDVTVSTRVFSFSAGRFAFSIGGLGGSSLRLDKSLFKLALQGNQIGETYGLKDPEGYGLGIGQAGLSWGQPIQVGFADHFALGFSLNLLYGGAYGKVNRGDLTLTTFDYGFDIDGEYEVTYAFGRLGWGLDAGTATQFGDKWTLSVGLANVMGSIPWSNEVKMEVGYIQGDSLSVIDISEDDDDEDGLQDSTWTVEMASFSEKLPTILRIGAAFEEGPVLLTADYCQGFQNSAFANTKPRFAVGTEWRGVSWLPLRMGVIVGGRIGFGTSFGFGFRPGGFVLDIGVMNRGFISPKNSKGLVVALEMGVGL